MDALTICAANYLPFAKVLAKSFIENHPNSKFYLLLVDGDVSDVDPRLVSGMQLVKPSDLDISSEKFLRMTVYYDVTELSTALKPLGLKYLLDNGSKIAIVAIIAQNTLKISVTGDLKVHSARAATIIEITSK